MNTLPAGAPSKKGGSFSSNGKINDGIVAKQTGKTFLQQTFRPFGRASLSI